MIPNQALGVASRTLPLCSGGSVVEALIIKKNIVVLFIRKKWKKKPQPAYYPTWETLYIY